MKQKILDDCFANFILFTFLVGLYWLGGGDSEIPVDGSFHHGSKVSQGDCEIP
jgi:hypothetical protein